MLISPDMIASLMILCVAGLGAGLLAGLLGVGGGLIVVPTLYWVLQALDTPADIAMALATATSLATIVPTSLSSAWAHYRQKNLCPRLLRSVSLGLLVGVAMGVSMASVLTGEHLRDFFGVVCLLLALKMLLWRESALMDHWPPQPIPTLGAMVVGSVSSIAGIGGGALGVPLMRVCGVSIHHAVGTSAAFGMLIALPSAILFMCFPTPQSAPWGTLGLIHWPAWCTLVPLMVLMAPVGAKLASNIPAKWLQGVFTASLLVVGLRMLLG